MTPAALPAMLKCAWPRPAVGDTVVTHAATFTPATPVPALKGKVLARVLDNYRESARRGINYAWGHGWANPVVRPIMQLPTRQHAEPVARKAVNLLSKNGKRLPLRAIPFDDLNRAFWSKGLVARPDALETTTPRALTLHEKMVDPSTMSADEIRDSIDYEPLSESRRAWLELGVHASMIHGVGGGMLSLEGYAEGSIGETLFASVGEIELANDADVVDPLESEFADEASSFGKGIAYETMSPTLLKQIAWEMDMARSGELVRVQPLTKPDGGVTFRTTDWARRPLKLVPDQLMRVAKGAKRALSQTLGVEHGIGDSAEALLERIAAIRADALASGVTVDFETCDPDEERERFLAPAPAEWHSAYVEVHRMVEILSEDLAAEACWKPRCSTAVEHRHVQVARKHHRRAQNIGSADEFWNQGVFDVAAHELGTDGLVDDLVIEPFAGNVKRQRLVWLRGAWRPVEQR